MSHSIAADTAMLKMDVTLLSTYQTTWYHIPKDHHGHGLCHGSGAQLPRFNPRPVHVRFVMDELALALAHSSVEGIFISLSV